MGQESEPSDVTEESPAAPDTDTAEVDAADSTAAPAPAPTPAEEPAGDDVETASDADEPLDVLQVAGERDEYLDALRRLQADFENYKKRMQKQQSEAADRAAEALVEKLLPVLDTVDLARTHGAGEAVDQVAAALVDVLGREGLERVGEGGQTFDPTEHDAVLHEEGDGEPVIVDVMRAGYRWRGRLLRPAMVKVKGS